MRRLLLLTLLLVTLPAASSHASAVVHGQWRCLDRGEDVALAGARLELRTPGLFGTTVDTGFTDANGEYRLTAPRGGEHFVRIVLDDTPSGPAGVHLADFLAAWDWYTDSPTFNLGEGTNEVGADIIRDGAGNTPVCATWEAIKTAFDEFTAETGGFPPYGHDLLIRGNMWLNGGVPFTSQTAINWPSGFRTGPFGANDFDTARHEFAHTIRHAFDGDINEFLGDVGRFGYLRRHRHCDMTNPGFAFNEGWAEYWVGDTTPCTADPEADEDIEGNVAAAIARLQARCSNTRTQMLIALRNTPRTIHSFHEYAASINVCHPDQAHEPPAPRAQPIDLVPTRGTDVSLLLRQLRRQSSHLRAQLDASGAVRGEILRGQLGMLDARIRAGQSFASLTFNGQVRGIDALQRKLASETRTIARRAARRALAAIPDGTSNRTRRILARAAAGRVSALLALVQLPSATPVVVREGAIVNVARPNPTGDGTTPSPEPGTGTPPPSSEQPPASKQATSLTASCAPGKSAFPQPVQAGGTLSPAFAGATIRVVYTRGQAAPVTQTATTAADGTWSDSYKPPAAGTYSVQAFYDGDGGHEASQAAACDWVVQP